MIKEKFTGIIPVFYACYEDDGSISEQRTRAFARHLISKGIYGLYVCSSSGECIYLSKEERKRILEWVMEEADGKVTVIAYVACNNTADSMELAAHAQSLRVDAIAAIPPIYFKLPAVRYQRDHLWYVLWKVQPLCYDQENHSNQGRIGSGRRSRASGKPVSGRPGDRRSGGKEDQYGNG